MSIDIFPDSSAAAGLERILRSIFKLRANMMCEMNFDTIIRKNVRCEWQHTYEKGPLVPAGICSCFRNSSVDRRIHYKPMAGLLTYAS